MADVKIKEKSVEATEEVEELQTTFNEDSLKELVEEGEVENVYKEK